MNINAVDLHIHTCYSDGTIEYKGLINLAKENNLSVISVTDHDSVEFYKKIDSINGIKMIPGIELTSKYHDSYLHILGYYINPDYISLSQYLSEYRAEQNLKTIKFMREIKRMHLRPEFERNILKRKMRRLQIKKEIELHNIDASVYDYIDGVIASLENSNIVLTTNNCVKLIRDAGGISFLAHPGLYYKDIAALENTLDDVNADGIECYTPHHDTHFIEECIKLAERRFLLISGGSDYHSGTYFRPKPFSGHGLALTNPNRMEVSFKLHEYLHKK